MTTKIYNLKKQLPDPRDIMYATTPEMIAALPTTVDLRDKMPPVFNQGQLGSCTANAISGAIEFLNESYEPSRLFIYYNERLLMNTVSSDSGSTIRDSVKVTRHYGACPESMWPYIIPQNVYTVPPVTCYNHAKPDLVTGYQSIADLNGIKSSLASGLPVAFGFVVYAAMESPEVEQSGILPMPDLQDKPLGGHAVLAVGYDDAKEMIIVRNSWGAAWGDDGYFYMPYAYISNPQLAFDFWSISKL